MNIPRIEQVLGNYLKKFPTAVVFNVKFFSQATPDGHAGDWLNAAFLGSDGQLAHANCYPTMAYEGNTVDRNRFHHLHIVLISRALLRNALIYTQPSFIALLV